jgi:diguanylate cyclase (GGDEF)-like protein
VSEATRILVCDDEPQIVRALRVILRDAGYEAVPASNGEEALDRAAVKPPAAAIVDLMLPDIDGVEVTKRLREWSEMPIIVLSAVGEEGEKVRALAAGADDYVTKPFAIEELMARVGTVLRRSKAMRDLSPLTGLPGNFRISEELDRRVVTADPVAIVYADLDNFKAYNDHYGFMRGDDVIKFTANTLIEAVMEVGDPSCFVGHVGGDDFICVMSPDDVERFCKTVVDHFDDGILDLYDAQDALRGYVEVIDRRGERHAFPIVSISLGVATNLQRTFVSAWEASAVASEMKEHAKSETGSAYRIDRRAR